MTIWVCYFEYDEREWDNCSHPVCFFLQEFEALIWAKKNEGSIQRMELGKEYAPR